MFWDLYGESGHPIRTTISEMGPLLLSRLMGLNETQEGVLSIAFKWADDQGLLLLDLKDPTPASLVKLRLQAIRRRLGTAQKQARPLRFKASSKTTNY